MTAIRDYVTKLTDEQRVAIVRDYEKFEAQGHIGECSLRRHATKVMKLYGTGVEMITIWMKELAYEIFRFYAGVVIRSLTSDDPTPADD